MASSAVPIPSDLQIRFVDLELLPSQTIAWRESAFTEMSFYDLLSANEK